MGRMSRRDLLATTAIAGSAAVTAAAAQAPSKDAATTSVPKTSTASAGDFPVFRYPLGEQPRKMHQGGWSREATAAEFPVSTKLGGVQMQLEAGGLRELHWHANAAEWAYVIEGRCRVTVIDPSGTSETVDFGPGDVWYFPRGHGHSIQGLGPVPCQFMLVFDNGYFSEFATFSITDWIAHTPAEVLARNFGVPAAVFGGFPRQEVYITRGPVPPPLPADPPVGSQRAGPLTHRYRLLAQQPKQYGGGEIRLVSMQEFPISTTMTGAIIRLKPGALRELHWHPNADEWQYFISGRTRMTVFGSSGRARTEEYGPGDAGYVPTGYGHHIENIGSTDAEILIVLNSGSYEEISITGWMASNARLLLSTNFGVPEDVLRRFPTREVFIAGG